MDTEILPTLKTVNEIVLKNGNGSLRSSKKKESKENIENKEVKEELFSPPSIDRGSEKSKEVEKEEEEFNLKRRRSKSFSELLLPHFKEIVPITVRIFFHFILSRVILHYSPFNLI